MSSALKLWLPLALVILGGCNSLEDKTGGAQDRVQTAGSIDFALVRERIFEPRCLSCHVQYGTYQGVRAEMEVIAKAVDSNRMPKGTPLQQPLKDLLRDWIQDGAPEKIGQAPAPLPTELEPTWASLSARVLHPRCTLCHNPNGQARFLDLSTRQAVFEARDRVFADGAKLVNFSDPAGSYLIQVVLDEAEPMPPAWSNLPRLSSVEVSVLEEWIGRGLP